MKIYTKTGDQGTTALFGGTRVLKSHERIEAYGTVDELNALIGLLASYAINEKRKEFLIRIQEILFSMGALLAADPNKKNLKLPTLTQDHINALEASIDHMEENLPELKSFILPGGHKEVAFCHLARTVCRRAERNVVKLGKTEKLPNYILIYLNRLSDYLFVLARKMTQELGAEEIPWKNS